MYHEMRNYTMPQYSTRTSSQVSGNLQDTDGMQRRSRAVLLLLTLRLSVAAGFASYLSPGCSKVLALVDGAAVVIMGEAPSPGIALSVHNAEGVELRDGDTYTSGEVLAVKATSPSPWGVREYGELRFVLVHAQPPATRLALPR